MCLMTSHWKFYRIFRLKNGFEMGFWRRKKNRSFQPYKWTTIIMLESCLALNFSPQIIRESTFKISQNFHFADMQFTIKRIEWTRPYGNCFKFTAHTQRCDAFVCVCACVSYHLVKYIDNRLQLTQNVKIQCIMHDTSRQSVYKLYCRFDCALILSHTPHWQL